MFMGERVMEQWDICSDFVRSCVEECQVWSGGEWWPMPVREIGLEDVMNAR